MKRAVQLNAKAGSCDQGMHLSAMTQTDLGVLDELVEEYMLQEELTDKVSFAYSDLHCHTAFLRCCVVAELSYNSQQLTTGQACL